MSTTTQKSSRIENELIERVEKVKSKHQPFACFMRLAVEEVTLRLEREAEEKRQGK